MFIRDRISFLEKWWLSIDRRLLIIFLILVFLGCLFNFSFSGAVANKIGLETYHFFKHQLLFTLLSLGTVFILSQMDETGVKKSIFPLFTIAFGLMLCIPIFGFQTKGARRWIRLGNFSFQPVEILKPSLILLNAHMISKFFREKNRNYLVVDALACLANLFLMAKQPDIGTLILMGAVLFFQLFLLDFVKIKHCLYLLAAFSFLGMVLYGTLPHVADRINSFLGSLGNVEKANYQVRRSIMSYRNGGWLGRGFLEGNVKNYIPDVHTDFIFPAVAEEFGFFVTLSLIFTYAYVVFRVMLLALEKEAEEKNRRKDGGDCFVFLALEGLAFEIFLQMAINLGVSMNMLPTKGMTLPLLSYGGSSLLGMAISFGYILALTKKSFGFCSAVAEDVLLLEDFLKNK